MSGRDASPAVRILRRLWASRLIGWLLIAALLSLWEASKRLGWISSDILPPVSAIFSDLGDEFVHGTMGSQLGVTLLHMLYGYVIGALVGVTAGIAIGESKWLWRLFEPMLEIARPIPISSVIPLLILFLGIDDALKITVIAIATFFPVFMNTFAGVRAVSRTMRETGRTFGLSAWRSALVIVVPAAAPMIFVGLRFAVSIGLVVALVSEMIAGNNGMGYFVIRAQQNLSVVQLFVGVFTLAALGYFLNFGFLLIEGALLPWHTGSTRRRST